MAIKQSTSDFFFELDLEHYFKVKRARQEKGIARNLPCPEVEHTLKGCFLKDNKTGNKYFVEKVVKDWWCGYFYVALLSIGNSHGIRYIENISCIDPTITSQIDEFNTDFSKI